MTDLDHQIKELRTLRKAVEMLKAIKEPPDICVHPVAGGCGCTTLLWSAQRDNILAFIKKELE